MRGFARTILLAAVLAAPAHALRAQAPPPGYQDDAGSASSPEPPSDVGLVADIKGYFTAPLHWNGEDWALFGGALAAIGVAHHYDTQVRTHFEKEYGASLGASSKDLQDALPAVGVLAGTWLFANLVNDSDGRREAWMMLEAAGLGSVTAYGLKFVAGREGPDDSADPNEWFKAGGGKSFPSWHATAAFAVGTVLAESGNDDYRWLRRLLGYGLGAGTDYLRLKHNAHWFSDVVAGSALGAASARFAMRRSERATDRLRFTLLPVPGGAVLSCSAYLP
jgi:membrane-associated phospholipid phosphatase